MSVIIILIVGALVGWVAGMIMRSGGGIVFDIVPRVAVSSTFSPQACAKPQQLRGVREVDARQFRMRCAQPVVTGAERAVIWAS